MQRYSQFALDKNVVGVVHMGWFVTMYIVTHIVLLDVFHLAILQVTGVVMELLRSANGLHLSKIAGSKV